MKNLLDVVPRVYRSLETALNRVYPNRDWRVPSFLRFGSWIGGDRDGHPGVSASTTAAAIRLQQESLLEHYIDRVGELWRKLSQSDRLGHMGADFLDSLAADARIFPEIQISGHHEPYRLKCRMIAAKLRRTLEFINESESTWYGDDPGPRPLDVEKDDDPTDDNDLPLRRKVGPPGVYLGRRELLRDLELIAVDLKQSGSSASAAGSIQDMIRLVEVFGVHLLTLDLRQHSARHTEALDEVLRSAGVCSNYAQLSPDERFDLLARELDSTRPLIPAHLNYSAETTQVVRTFRTVAAILERQCPEAIDKYIISSTTDPAHLLEVLLLAREAELFRPSEGISRVDIVPLFEALEPLQSASGIMDRLFALPAYRKHLELRGNFQEVMIGYSDSSKESGSLQSAWALYRAQGDLVETGRRAGDHHADVSRARGSDRPEAADQPTVRFWPSPAEPSMADCG